MTCLVLSLAGAALGAAGLAAVSRHLSGLLFGVTSTDPAIFGAALLLLLGIACPASDVPAQRASRIDPMSALRLE